MEDILAFRTKGVVHSGGWLKRPRLLAWLDAHAGARLRLITAPPGSGKSVLLHDYLSLRCESTVYLKISADETAASLRHRIAEALGLCGNAVTDLVSLCAALDEAPPATLVIDNADAGATTLVELLNGLFEAGPDHIRYIVAARSRCVARNARLFVEGAAVRLPSTMLRFTAAELAQVCDQRGLSYEPKELTALLAKTDGWVTIVAASLRFAAQSGCSVGESADRWLAEHQATFTEYVQQEVSHTTHNKAFSRVVSAGVVSDIDDLVALERDGVFVESDSGAGYELMRVVRQAFYARSRGNDPRPPQQVFPMSVSVLGEFTASVAGRRIEWARRRDAQIFKYVLLKPTGRASRNELLAAFWPDRDRQQALQALRTSCSNIRRALRDAVGSTVASEYFRADADVTVPVGSFVVDLHRFTSYVSAGNASLAHGDSNAALLHFKGAYGLYRGPLLIDVPNCHYTHLAKSVDEMFEQLYERLHGLQRRATDQSTPRYVRIVKRQDVAQV
ncbi:MAG: AAA family ATPase [Candidatus Baltobacteraceae bacterium]